MSKAARLTLAVSLTAIVAGLPLCATAQQPEQGKKPPARTQATHPGGPAGPPAHGVGPAPQVRAGLPPGGPVRGPGPGPAAALHGPGAVHAVHALGERGFSFRGAEHGRRDIATFNERERAVWLGGHWLHERRFGRLGYWWEVNGAWYFYDRPLAGPPTYVSEVEFFDDGLGAEVPVVVQPAPVVVVAPPVVYAPPPPVVCVGPLCVR
jgi:hypothetical protein